jgi:5'-deoxynucleotidase YfbR-like HD superfamily hydrolase
MTLQKETVSSHSFGVAWLVYFLRPDSRATLVMAALAHDLAEHQVGDIPAPAKRELGIGEQMNALEDRLLRAAGFDFDIDLEEARVLKIADCAQGALFCIRERSLGNRGVEIVFSRYLSYIAERVGLDSREVELVNTLNQLWREARDGNM